MGKRRTRSDRPSPSRDKRDLSKKGTPTICGNKDCRLRKAGCKGFEGCPGYVKRQK